MDQDECGLAHAIRRRDPVGLDAFAAHLLHLKAPSGIVADLSHIPCVESPSLTRNHGARHLPAGFHFRRGDLDFAVESGESRQADDGVRCVDADAEDAKARIWFSVQASRECSRDKWFAQPACEGERTVTRQNFSPRVQINCAASFAVVQKFVQPRASCTDCVAFGELLVQHGSFARRRADTPMPLHESEAIILQSYPLGEADRLVSFLSRTMGRMRGVASGARRTKSRFGSTLERLSHIRIWFFERETREPVRISQCEVIESFLNAFHDYAS